MPSWTTWRLIGAAVVATTLGLGLGVASTPAGACGRDCGRYGYRPAPVYSAPPVYTYRYAPVPHSSFYTTRVEIFRGPRWNYAAAYYNPIRGCRRHGCGHRAAYLSGPIILIPRGERRR
jgi:hypothetical protein